MNQHTQPSYPVIRSYQNLLTNGEIGLLAINFSTLGNLLVNPNAGLLFIDFERGNTLQLTGIASVI